MKQDLGTGVASNNNGRKRSRCPMCGRRTFVKVGASHYGGSYACEGSGCRACATIASEWEIPAWDEKGKGTR